MTPAQYTVLLCYVSKEDKDITTKEFLLRVVERIRSDMETNGDKDIDGFLSETV
jgi:hypothetical protein